MSENTKIEWTHHTFNPWWGCAKVSPGCDHCYAERDAGRFAPTQTLWGVDAARRAFGDKHWNEPLRWNAKAAKEGVRRRVFAASMADVFDKNAPDGARERLFDLIRATPHLDWLLLTKRIGNAYKGMLPIDFNAKNYPNVWLGISVVNQEEADRDIPKLLGINARVRWLSMEPLLELVHLDQFHPTREPSLPTLLDGVDWVIVGGESGPKARPMHPEWARSLRDQCAAAGVPFLFKQWGEFLPADDDAVDPFANRFIWSDGQPWLESDGQRGGVELMAYIGKKAAGRRLDGALHNGYPRVGL